MGKVCVTVTASKDRRENLVSLDTEVYLESLVTPATKDTRDHLEKRENKVTLELQV